MTCSAKDGVCATIHSKRFSSIFASLQSVDLGAATRRGDTPDLAAVDRGHGATGPAVGALGAVRKVGRNGRLRSSDNHPRGPDGMAGSLCESFAGQEARTSRSGFALPNPTAFLPISDARTPDDPPRREALYFVGRIARSNRCVEAALLCLERGCEEGGA